MAMQVVDYMDQYVNLCKSKNTFIIRSLQDILEAAIEGGEIPTEFKLNGNCNELRYTRINDEYLELLMNPLQPPPKGSGYSHLKSLDLGYNEIGDEGAKMISKYLLDNKVMENLNLMSNCIGPNGASSLAKTLHINKTLNSLNLSQNSIEDSGGMSFAEMLQINTSLRSLYLARCNLGTASLIAFSTVLQEATSIHLLDISGNSGSRTSLTQSLQNDVMGHISRMCKLNGWIKELRLEKMGITDWIVTDVFAEAIKINKRLEVLSLATNKISRDGGVALCRALHNHQTIVELNLSHCSIQDEGAFAVKEMLLNNSVLSRLYLESNSITGKGLVAISEGIIKNQNLEKLALWGNKWNVLACEAFNPLIGGTLRNLKIGSTEGKPVPQKLRKRGLSNAPVPLPRVSVPAVVIDANDQIATVAGPNDDLNKGKQKSTRLQNVNVDFVFYAVEGILNVARNTEWKG